MPFDIRTTPRGGPATEHDKQRPEVGRAPLLCCRGPWKLTVEVADRILRMSHGDTLADVLLSDRVGSKLPDEFAPPVVRIPEIIALEILPLPPIPPRSLSSRYPTLDLIDFLYLALVDGERVPRRVRALPIQPPHAAGGLE
jgi:hypothetical protein